MISVEKLTSLLQKHLQDPSLMIFAEKDWGSHNPKHRELMQSFINGVPDFRDPWLKHSRSHAPGVGIILLSRKAVGVDVEVTSRVKEVVIRRISLPAEVEDAPGFSQLWCAKEAAFKALQGFQQPAVMSAVAIGDWQRLDSHTETFRLLNPTNFQAPSDNKGVTVTDGPFTYGFFSFST